MRESAAMDVIRSDRNFSLRLHWEEDAGIFYTIQRIMKWKDDFCRPSFGENLIKKSHYLLSKLRYAPPPFNYSKGDCEIEEDWLTKEGI